MDLNIQRPFAEERMIVKSVNLSQDRKPTGAEWKPLEVVKKGRGSRFVS
jgi:hypothetical protein